MMLSWLWGRVIPNIKIPSNGTPASDGVSFAGGAHEAVHCESPHVTGGHRSVNGLSGFGGLLIHGDNNSLSGSLANPEYTKRIPLNPQVDESNAMNVYKWGNEPLPMSRQFGAKPISDVNDQHHHEAVRYAWPTDARPFYPNSNPEADRINPQFHNMQSDLLPENGYCGSAHRFVSRWERLLARHHGLPCADNQSRTSAYTEDEIRQKVNQFSEMVHHDDPQDSCKYLAIEEHKCLLAHQSHIDPEVAAQKCVKWFIEWSQCKWDSEKMDKGISYIQDREPSKRKPYIGAPNYQYA